MPDCATWWFDHVGQTYLYMVAVRQKDEREQIEEIDKLLSGAEDWGKILKLPAAGQMMVEHVAQTKSLVDAAFEGNLNAVDAAVEELLSNIARQSEFYAMNIPGFPVEDWTANFTRYVTSFGGYVLALAYGDTQEFRKNLDQAVQSRNALARLWGRVCLARSR